MPNTPRVSHRGSLFGPGIFVCAGMKALRF
jgi:hypothetical protein